MASIMAGTICSDFRKCEVLDGKNSSGFATLSDVIYALIRLRRFDFWEAHSTFNLQQIQSIASVNFHKNQKKSAKLLKIVSVLSKSS